MREVGVNNRLFCIIYPSYVKRQSKLMYSCLREENGEEWRWKQSEAALTLFSLTHQSLTHLSQVNLPSCEL